MSTKDIHAMNHWYALLVTAEIDANRAVTAGQVAKWAGTARSTARRWLERLVAEGVASKDRCIAKNGFDEIRFASQKDV